MRALNRIVILFILVAAVLSIVAARTGTLLRMQEAPDQVVALVVDEHERSAADRAPWETYADEQGIPHVWITQRDLELASLRFLRAHFVAIVVPDRVNRVVSEDAAVVLTEYANAGGNVLVVGDAGTRIYDGRFANRAELANLAGVDYLLFRSLGKKAFGHATIQFADPRVAALWHVPPGKLEGGRISSYQYGTLDYALPATRASNGTQVDAGSSLGPAFTERHAGAGTVFYVALELGYLRSIGDSFPMHIAMRHVIIDTAATPHLVAAPDARGEIIFNWHIDSNAEWIGIPSFAANGLLRHDVRYDFDVTAGPDLARVHDDQGFDACGRGKALLEELERYGTIGSHGGWAHNLFAYAVEAGHLDQAQMTSLIAENDACLQSVTHRPVLDYAAPDGAHPWQMTDAIGSLGIRAYYYTGDTGMPPELAFYGGKLVSNSVWAFPIMPDGSVASFAEMSNARIPPKNVARWLVSTLDQAERDRSIYLMYSHVYDLQRHQQYIAPFAAFLSRVENDQRRGLATATTMVAASAFLDRFVKTRVDFVRADDGVVVSLANPEGLRDIAFALPRSWLTSDVAPASVISAGEDATFSYYAVNTNATRLNLRFTRSGRNS